MGRTISIAVVLLALLAGFTSSADAQRMRMPVSYQQRPMTLPRGALRPEVGSVLTRVRGRDDADDVWLHATGGLSVGVTHDFELGMLFLPLRLAPSVDYGSGDPGLPPLVTPWFGHNRPDLYGRYRFLDGDVEIGLDVHFILPVPEDFYLVAGVPFLFRIAEFMRIDLGFYVEARKFEQAWGYAPLVLTFNPSRRFFFGFDGGVRFGHGAEFPLGFFMGFTLGGKPTADIKFGTRVTDIEHGFAVWQAWLAIDFFIFL